jgi:shikimate dehydrogenase
MLAGVLGWPVRHSRSPAMFRAAFAEHGLDWRYLPLPVPTDFFEITVRALPASGYAGVNVTLPHKLAAHAICDDVSETARAIGAANSLTFSSGVIQGDNTDAPGLLDAIGEPVAGRTALVLGAGGAGRAAVWALREAGAEVSLWNRTPERAAALASELDVRHLPRPESADLLVNTTTVGLDPGGSEGGALAALGLAGMEPPRLVVDMVYGPEPTPLVRWAERAGGRVVDGLEMLVRQGARSFASWTGLDPPIEVMREAAHHG